MTRTPLAVDFALAAVIAILIVIIEPGVAIAAILALILLVVCGISYLIARQRRTRGQPTRRRPSSAPPPRRRPPARPGTGGR